MQDIRTDDGMIVHEGDRVYNYYDMWPGTIVPGSIRDYSRSASERPDGKPNPRIDLWFDVQRDGDDERDKAMLNGARICTIAYAIRRGFKGV